MNLQKQPHRGGQPVATNVSQYRLVVGGVSYRNDEIPANLAITMNVSAQGYSVGNLATVTISGTVPYRNNLIDRNSMILLYVTPAGSESEALIYFWFLKSATVYDESSLTFSGVDAMAYTSNDYAIHFTKTKVDGVEVCTAYDSIGTQFQTAATTISSLCGTTVTIQPNGSGVVTNANQGDYRTTNSIKSLLEESAKFDAVNYYTQCNADLSASILKVASSTTILYDYAPLTLGAIPPTINRVMVSLGDNSDVKYDYTGSASPTPAGTVSIQTPFLRLYSTNQMSVIQAEPTNCQGLLGESTGREFSCAKAYVGIYNFFIPMTKLIFRYDTDTYTYSEMITWDDLTYSIGTGTNTDVVGFRVWGPWTDTEIRSIHIGYIRSSRSRQVWQEIPTSVLPIAEGSYYDLIWEDDTFTNESNTNHEIVSISDASASVQIIRKNSSHKEVSGLVLTHAQYYLTTLGIYASISGSARNVSDFDFVGTTEQRIRNKINLDQPYNEIIMSKEGLLLTPTIPPRDESTSQATTSQESGT